MWAAWSLAAPRRLERLSVGPAQVQLRHWRDLGLIAGVRLTPRRLATVRDWPSNARVIHAFLAARRALEESDVESLARLYTGGDRPGFAPRLAVARATVRAMSGR